jgi:arylamine N-acetyltransferase
VDVFGRGRAVPRYDLGEGTDEADDGVGGLAGQLWASIVTDNGRISMFTRVLTEYADGERVSSRVLTDDAEILKVFEDTYGITLEDVPDLPVTTEGV